MDYGILNNRPLSNYSYVSASQGFVPSFHTFAVISHPKPPMSGYCLQGLKHNSKVVHCIIKLGCNTYRIQNLSKCCMEDLYKRIFPDVIAYILLHWHTNLPVEIILLDSKLTFPKNICSFLCSFFENILSFKLSGRICCKNLSF